MTIRDIIFSKTKNYKLPTKSSFSTDELSEIYKSTDFLPKEYPLSVRIKYIINNFSSHRICPICSNKIDDSKGPDLKIFCSRKCATLYLAQNKVIKNKRDNTNIEKYGVSNLFKCKEYQQKIFDTKRKKYSNDQGKLLTHHKHDIVAKLNSKEWMENAFNEYGIEWMCDELQVSKHWIYKKILDLNIRQRKKRVLLTKEQKQIIENYQWLKDAFENGENIKSLSIKLNIDYGTLYKYCRNHPSFIPNNTSSFEIEICDFLDKFGVSYIRHDRKLISPKEIDIYIPEKNLAIEFHGSYWHSYDRTESTEERRKHQQKWKMCLEKGVQLLSIFEYEWLENSERWKNFIRAKLNKTTNHIGARKCEVIKQIPLYMVKEFYEKNHLQGYTSACKYNYALAYNNKIVAMMSFSRTRFQKRAKWELMRFAVDNEYRIPGAASKLLSIFRKEYEGPIVSYSDNRYSLGNVYMILGFEKIEDVEPRYVYLNKNGTYYTRMSCQKKKIEKFLTDYDASKTEAENMFANGYKRMWDCGKMTWLLT